MDSYTTQYFDLYYGVKQGGVISAIFFTLYIDSLLIKLKESGDSCHINRTFMGAISYANDITIISPSIRGLKQNVIYLYVLNLRIIIYYFQLC